MLSTPVWRARLHGASSLSEADRAFLLARCDDLEADLARQAWSLPVGPVHGDAHTGNLVPGPDSPIMCDFDSACVGPREWDLVPVIFGAVRFGEPRSEVERLLTAYGSDVRESPGVEVLLRVRELKLVASVTPLLDTNPAVCPEFDRRLRSLQTDDRDLEWHRYS